MPPSNTQPQSLFFWVVPRIVSPYAASVSNRAQPVTCIFVPIFSIRAGWHGGAGYREPAEHELSAYRLLSGNGAGAKLSHPIEASPVVAVVPIHAHPVTAPVFVSTSTSG